MITMEERKKRTLLRMNMSNEEHELENRLTDTDKLIKRETERNKRWIDYYEKRKIFIKENIKRIIEDEKDKDRDSVLDWFDHTNKPDEYYFKELYYNEDNPYDEFYEYSYPGLHYTVVV